MYTVLDLAVVRGNGDMSKYQSIHRRTIPHPLTWSNNVVKMWLYTEFAERKYLSRVLW